MRGEEKRNLAGGGNPAVSSDQLTVSRTLTNWKPETGNWTLIRIPGLSITQSADIIIGFLLNTHRVISYESSTLAN